MPKEILIQIINQKLYFQLFFITLAHFLVWFTNINLGVYLLTKKMVLAKAIPFIVLSTLWTLVGHTVVPDIIFGFVVLALMCLSVKILGKTPLVVAVSMSALTYFIIGINMFILENFLFALYPPLSDFLLKTPLGTVFGSLLEIILPLIILFIIRVFQLQPKLFIRKQVTFLDVAGIFLLLDLLYFFFDTGFSVVKNYANHQVIPVSIVSQWSCAIAGIAAFYIVMTYTRTDYEKEITEKEALKKQLREMIAQNNAEIIAAVKDISQPDPGQDLAIQLTGNELRILKLLVEGKSNKEIASELTVNGGTVRNSISKLLEKFGLEDRTQLAIHAFKNLKL